MNFYSKVNPTNFDSLLSKGGGYETGKDFSSHGAGGRVKPIPWGNLVYPGYQHIPVSRFPNPDAATYAEITRKEEEIMSAGIGADGKPVNEPWGPKPGQSYWDWYMEQWRKAMDADPLVGEVKSLIDLIKYFLQLPMRAYKFLRDNPAIAAVLAILLVYKFLF